ncbi:MAG TPA: hypothetical protein VG013_22250 [Gemmataceae bacterium]|jgi:hypothetical protein|nr:hypothetical protein [Gemmataceae bacterium]
MQTAHATTTESAIWGRLLGLGTTTPSVEAARSILKIDFPQSDKDRMRQLAANARKGTLTPEEQDEIDSYGRIGSFISIMKSKARIALRKAQGNGSFSKTHEA